MRLITLVLPLFLCLLCITVKAQDTSSEDRITELYNNLKSAVSTTEKEKLVVEIERLSTSDDFSKEYLVDAAKSILVSSFIEHGDLPKSLYWMDRFSDPLYRTSSMLEVIHVLLSRNQLKEASELLESEMKKESAKDATGKRIDDQFRFLYGELKYRSGDYENAIVYLKPVLSSRFASANFKELYVQALIKKNQVNTTVIEEVMLLDGERSDLFLKDVEGYFQNAEGNSDSFENLRERTHRQKFAKIKAKVEKMAVDIKAPDFSIRDTEGKEASLSSLKGKTVILDFWATWCQPCVASFPGMKRALDYFKNREDVVFMFIHTAERMDSMKATEAALALVKEKGYVDFDVFMDLKDVNSGNNPLLSLFNVNALPTKLIINKEGVIKFKNTGYVEASEAVEEIKLMVELANK